MQPDPSRTSPIAPASDADAVRGWGADILAAVDLDAIAARLSQLPAGVLLADLEALLDAIDQATPAGSRRRAGWWGRLLGRDLVAQAQPDPLPVRIHLRLDAAHRHSDALAAQIAALEPVTAHLQAQIARLEQRIAEARGAAVADAALQRRLSHLDAIAASWRATTAQIALVRAHAVHLLDRHAQLRDLLLSLRREQNAAQAAASQLAPVRFAALHDALRELQANAPSFSAPAADTDRPTQESSP